MGVEGTPGNGLGPSVTGGSDELCAVAVTVDAEGRKVTGRGVATDVVDLHVTRTPVWRG